MKIGIDKSTKEKVSIKIIEKLHFKSEELLNIKTEIEILKICTHPCIIKFIDHFENSEYIFIVLERIDQSLKDFIAEKGLSEINTQSIFYQILNAFSYLHKFGIIYINLCLENISVKTTHEALDVKLFNFNNSVLSSGNTNTKEINITSELINFSAPEVLRKEKFDNKANIWSLGVLIY